MEICENQATDGLRFPVSSALTWATKDLSDPVLLTQYPRPGSTLSHPVPPAWVHLLCPYSLYKPCFSRPQLDVFNAAEQYQQAGLPLIILAGKEYGSGSSRDWAAKGPFLLVSVAAGPGTQARGSVWCLLGSCRVVDPAFPRVVKGQRGARWVLRSHVPILATVDLWGGCGAVGRRACAVLEIIFKSMYIGLFLWGKVAWFS